MSTNCKMPWKRVAIYIYSSFNLFIWLSCLARADVIVLDSANVTEEIFPDFPAQFSPKIASNGVQGKLVISSPDNACSDIAGPPDGNQSYFLLVKRYGCTFEEKAMRAHEKGYSAVIIYNIETNIIQPFGHRDSDIYIPTVLVGKSDGIALYDKYTYKTKYTILITDDLPFNLNNYLLPFAIVVAVCFVIMLVFTIVKCIRDRRRTRRNRLPSKQLKKIPTKKFKKGDQYDVCAICLDDYTEGEKLRILPCSHAYHTRCIDPWLTNNKRNCPVCKRKVFVKDRTSSDASDSDSDDGGSRSTERTPLLSSTQSAPAGQSNYGFNRSLLMQAEEEGAQAGPSSQPEPEENLESNSQIPTTSDVAVVTHDHPVVVTIVPSLHSVNADESDTGAVTASTSDSSGSDSRTRESRRSRGRKKSKRGGVIV